MKTDIAPRTFKEKTASRRRRLPVVLLAGGLMVAGAVAENSREVPASTAPAPGSGLAPTPTVSSRTPNPRPSLDFKFTMGAGEIVPAPTLSVSEAEQYAKYGSPQAAAEAAIKQGCEATNGFRDDLAAQQPDSPKAVARHQRHRKEYDAAGDIYDYSMHQQGYMPPETFSFRAALNGAGCFEPLPAAAG